MSVAYSKELMPDGNGAIDLHPPALIRDERERVGRIWSGFDGEHEWQFLGAWRVRWNTG